jgi:epoxyqueuosine reductase
MGAVTEIKDRIVARALEEGFIAARICAPEAVDIREALTAFVNAGHHGQMSWLADRINWRGAPAALWPDARSVLMLAESYTPSHDPLDILNHKDRAAISVYAKNRDYHDLVKKRLKRLGRWMVSEFGCDIKVFVDTAPVPEKALGQAAGLGWQGKHTNLVSRDWGNWAFLGAVFTTLDLPVDAPEVDHCGSCRACLDICPTKAFPAPGQIDARRCISYLTIEHKGPVDPELRRQMGNRIYGCDDCLAVCPWNKFAVAAREIGYSARAELMAPRLDDLVALDDASFRQVFSGSPIKRIGRNRFVRNVLYAIGNSGSARLRIAAQARLEDADATVADAARWAVERLS